MTWILALGLAALALAAAGCGGDDNEGSGDGTGSSATSTPTETATEDAGGSGGAGETLTVTADPGGGISWDKTSLTAKAGKVTLKLVNESKTPHAIEVEGNGVEDATDTVTGANAEVTLDLQPGEYEYYCPVGQHKQGMNGTLTVE